MKRSVSIVILAIFLFNIGGYYIVFWGLIRSADHTLSQRLDAGLYSNEDVIELKIPVAFPYPMQQDFKRIDGKFEHKGVHYKLVKHRLANDTVYIVCYKDREEKQLVKTMADYGKMANDIPSSSKKNVTFLGKLLKDFNTCSQTDVFHKEGWSRTLSFGGQVALFPNIGLKIPSPPPKS